MVEYYKYNYYHSYKYEPLEIQYTYKRYNFELTFTYPGHLTPLLGMYYYKNLPEGHVLKLNQKIPKMEVYGLEKHTLEDINDFFSLFGEDRYIKNVEKLIFNYEKYKYMFWQLGFHKNNSFSIDLFIPPGDYTMFKEHFPEDEQKTLNENIRYSLGFLKRKNKDFYKEEYRVKHRLEWFDYFQKTLKIKFDFLDYIQNRENHNNNITKQRLYCLNKYTYENPNSGFEDPIFLKEVDKFIKNTENKLITFDFMQYLTYKEYKYLISNGFSIDYSSFTIQNINRNGFINMLYDILYFEEGFDLSILPTFDGDSDYFSDSSSFDLMIKFPNGDRCHNCRIFENNYTLHFYEKIYEKMEHDKLKKIILYETTNKYYVNYFLENVKKETLKWILNYFPETQDDLKRILFEKTKIIKEQLTHTKKFENDNNFTKSYFFKNILKDLVFIFKILKLFYESNILNKEYFVHEYEEKLNLKKLLIKIINLSPQNKNFYETLEIYNMVKELNQMIEKVRWENDLYYEDILNIHNKIIKIDNLIN